MGETWNILYTLWERFGICIHLSSGLAYMQKPVISNRVNHTSNVFHVVRKFFGIFQLWESSQATIKQPMQAIGKNSIQLFFFFDTYEQESE